MGLPSPGLRQFPSLTLGGRTAQRRGMHRNSVDDIDEALIASSVELFQRELPRYQSLLELLVADLEKLGRLGVEKGGLPKCTIQSRIKGIDSLKGKLTQRVVDVQRRGPGTNSLNSTIFDALARLENSGELFDEVLIASAWRVIDVVPDLVGVRMMPYDAVDLRLLNESLDRLWRDEEFDSSFRLVTRPDDKARGYYRATHFRVEYDLSERGGARISGGDVPRGYLKGVRAEVQTTSLLQHLLNELNHDYVYKVDRDLGFDRGVSDRLSKGMATLEGNVSVLQALVNELMDVGRETGVTAVPDEVSTENRTPTIPVVETPAKSVAPERPLVDGQMLVFEPPEGERQTVGRWAQETGYDKEAVRARWQGDLGRLRWELNPAETYTPTALARIIRSRSGVATAPQPIDGLAHWFVESDSGEKTHRLADVVAPDASGDE